MDDTAIFEAPDIIKVDGGGGIEPRVGNDCKGGSGYWNTCDNGAGWFNSCETGC